MLHLANKAELELIFDYYNSEKYSVIVNQKLIMKKFSEKKQTSRLLIKLVK